MPKQRLHSHPKTQRLELLLSYVGGGERGGECEGGNELHT